MYSALSSGPTTGLGSRVEDGLDHRGGVFGVESAVCERVDDGGDVHRPVGLRVRRTLASVPVDVVEEDEMGDAFDGFLPLVWRHPCAASAVLGPPDVPTDRDVDFDHQNSGSFSTSSPGVPKAPKAAPPSVGCPHGSVAGACGPAVGTVAPKDAPPVYPPAGWWPC